jgi:hypothetical protein
LECLVKPTCFHTTVPVKVKVKVTHNRLEIPEGVRGITLHSLDLGSLEGGGWSAPRPGRFNPGTDPISIVQEAGGGAGLDVCEKSRPPPGFDPRTVQPVASRYTD